MLVIIIGNFFLMNLFVGIIITTYNRQKDLGGNDFMLTQPLPGNEWRQPCHYIAQDWYFQNFILLCIIVNTVTFTLEWYGWLSPLARG